MDVFLIVDHLLKCLDILLSLEDKSPFLKLFINAGNKGRQYGAHDMAFNYYKAAIQVSDSEKEWNDNNYSITLQLYINALGLGFLLGDNEMTEDWIQLIFKHAKTPLDRIATYLIQSRYHLSQQKPFEGLDALITCLEDLGNEKFIFEDAEKIMHEEIHQLEKATGHMDVDEITDIGLSNDPYVYATAEVMSEL